MNNKEDLDKDLKTFIGALIKQKFNKDDLDKMIKSNTDSNQQPNIKISKSTIYSAGNNSNVIVNNNNNEVDQNERKKRKSNDSAGNNATISTEFEVNTSLSTSFKIKGAEILSAWNKYKVESNEFLVSGSATVECDVQRLLSQSHIMLIKKDEVSPDLKKLSDNETIDGIKKNVISQFDIEVEEIPNDIEQSMKNTVKKLIGKEINSRQASTNLTKLLTPTMDTPVDDCIMILKNLVERLPQKKTNTKTKESNLGGTFIDAIIRPILDDPDHDQFLVWSNLKVSDKNDERPDISALVLVDTRFDGPICIGEVKGEDKKDDTYAVTVDLMKIATFSKEVIDSKHYQDVLGIHVIGFHLTVYVTTLIAEGLYVTYEIASIPVPTNIYDVKAFIANLEDLLPVKMILKKCSQNNDNVQQFKKKGGSLQAIFQYIKSGKNRKRHCPYVLNY